MTSALQKLEEIAAFLEDHPGVELRHRNYRKLPAAIGLIRQARSAIRELRRGNSGDVRMHSRLRALDRILGGASARLAGMNKLQFREFVDGAVDRADALDLRAPLIPPLPKLPRGTPEWIRSQLKADYDEVERCLKAGANRAGIAFGARILECALGRKYFLRVKVDPVKEGWTLGKLVAESKNQGVLKDSSVPGVESVLEWLNKTRIASIHVKQKIYQPQPDQARLICELVLSLVPDLLTP